MALTINIDGFSNGIRSGAVQRISRNMGMVTGTITFDSSYSFGGEGLTGTGILDSNSKYTALNQFFFTDGTGSAIRSLEMNLPYGYRAVLNNTTKGSETIKLYKKAPAIVHEELVTVTSNVGYLKYPAAHINYIAYGNAFYVPIVGGLTPATGQCAVDLGWSTAGAFTRGSRTSLTFLAGDSVTAVKVSYITQAWKEVTDNMCFAKLAAGVSSFNYDAFGSSAGTLAFTAGTPDNIKLGTDFVAMTSITWDANGTYKVPNPLVDGATLSATLDMDIDYVKATTFGEVNWYATDAVDGATSTVYFHYIKKPTAGFIVDRFVEETIGDSSDTLTLTGQPLIYGCCGGIPMESSQKQARYCLTSATIPANGCKFTTHPWMPGATVGAAPIVTMVAATDVDGTFSYVEGNPSEVDCEDLEVPNATNLSNLSSIPFKAIGYIR